MQPHEFYGAVAQLGERRLCKPDVVGSIPISSTKAKLVASSRTVSRMSGMFFEN
jgi:hypothetical protein